MSEGTIAGIETFIHDMRAGHQVPSLENWGGGLRVHLPNSLFMNEWLLCAITLKLLCL